MREVEYCKDKSVGKIISPFFDYVKSEGIRLDSHAGLDECLSVLKFIKNKFKVLRGEISLDCMNISAVAAQKI